MSTDDSRTGSRWAVVPRLLVVSGIGLFLGVVAWIVAFAETLRPVDVVLGVALTGVPALGIVWAGAFLERSEVRVERYRRIAGWTVGVCLVFLLINLAMIVPYPWEPSVVLIWGLWSVVFGVLGGFAVGYVEARAIQRAAEAAAERARAEQLEEEREVLGYLNDLLRHEVFNSAQIIAGHTSLLLDDDLDERSRQRLETIQRESESLGDVIEDVRAMLEANRTGVDSQVDLSRLLADTVAGVRSTYPHATVELTAPESVAVTGNDGLRWVFSNLLENAVEHNDEEPRVDVLLETTGDEAVVTVSDDGPGIPPRIRADLFERKSRNHGLGLYLARIIANRYDGTVELAETGPEGSTFTVRLPLASDGTADADGDRASAADPSRADLDAVRSSE
ncbi:sensor histidine kinase [Halopiger goleimassiliensis]|uniref:sensor histidine kinase n=1 Tax=Halopiger goleimassiliensis TaxID=1293048 RepID=UPI0006781605|nr:sensor histidine kinase [Halopiger goleimassiliensis]